MEVGFSPPLPDYGYEIVALAQCLVDGALSPICFRRCLLPPQRVYEEISSVAVIRVELVSGFTKQFSVQRLNRRVLPRTPALERSSCISLHSYPQYLLTSTNLVVAVTQTKRHCAPFTDNTYLLIPTDIH